MSETEKYNGHTNFETWAVGLHLGNTETIYKQVLQVVEKGFIDWLDWTEKVNGYADPKHLVGQHLKTFWLGYIEKVWAAALTFKSDKTIRAASDLSSDMGSLWRVDWSDIADGWLEDFGEDIQLVRLTFADLK